MASFTVDTDAVRQKAKILEGLADEYIARYAALTASQEGGAAS